MTISIPAILVVLLIGAVAGWLASVVMRGRGLGILGNIVVGIIGALLANWLLPQLGIIIGGGLVAAIVNAFIGAVILLFLIGIIRRA